MNSTAITSTGMRVTQTLSAPPTQNTAPVHEYQCLYTSDLRRKQKRWQDGFLRFHTFNKRIMVYEAPSRNYVGDKHWREDGELQDGDELQLEKPILVQVGEQIGTTETDLTELLEKRRKPQDKVAEDLVGSPPRQNVSSAMMTGMAMLRSSLGQPSQLRPKTLNALLGTPKRPIGRASLPTKSPYELRQESENAEWGSNRPAKRQRLDSRPEVIPKATTRPLFRTLADTKTCAGRHDSIAVSDAVVDPPRQVQPAVRVCETIKKPEPALKSHSSRTELDMTNMDSAPSHTVPAKEQTKSPDANSIIKPARRLRTMEKPKGSRKNTHESPSSHINNSTTMIDTSRSSSINTARVVIEPIETMLEETACTGEPRKERMKLKMASRKPRKKLMYRDLLPQEQSPVRPSSSLETDPNGKSRERRISTRRSKGATPALVDFHQEEQDRLADRLNKYNGRSSHRNDDIESTTETRAQSLGLFVSQGDLTPLAAIHHTERDSPNAFYASTNTDPSSINPSKVSWRPPTHGSREPSVPQASSTVHETSLTLSKLDEILLPRLRSSHAIEISSPSYGVEDEFPVHVCSGSSVPVTTPKTMLGPTPQKGSPPTTLIPSSPDFQIQSHILAKQAPPEEVPSSQVPFLKTRQIAPESLWLSAQLPQASLNEEVSAKASELKGLHPMTSPSRAAAPVVRPPKEPSPKPTPPKALPARVNPPLKAPSPKSTSPEESPRKAAREPSLPKERSPNLPRPIPTMIQPTTITTKSIFANSPETSAPEFDLRIAQKPLPAFQAPRRKPRTRSPLKKSTSDITTMRPPSPYFEMKDERKQMVGVTNESTSTPWSKEAWDLFGCGRDGVQCSYEEFKRKEGLD